MTLHTLPVSSEITLLSAPEVSRALLRQKYAVANSSDFEIPPGSERDWNTFQRSWENLDQDRYLPDGGRYRFRRYGRFLLDQEALSLAELPHRAYFQSAEHNRVAGGFSRDFKPLEPYVCRHHILWNLILIDAKILGTLDPRARWHVDVHQIRTTASRQETGNVVPEGVHQDGMTFIATHLIERVHVTGGVSSIYDLDMRLIAELTLTDPLDVLYAFDEEVMHDASAIVVDGLHSNGHRDTLLLGFRPVEVSHE